MANKKKKVRPKTTWNYRLVRKVFEFGTEAGNVREFHYGIHEVYYNEDGKPTSLTIQPVDVSGDSKQDVRSTLSMMKKALEQPILNYEDIGSKHV